MNSKRNSSIELLRIISMFMIVLSHYCVHNGIVRWELPIGVNRFLIENGVLGNIGVIIFVLITGYFYINNKEPFKLRKLFILVFETLIYSSVIYLIFVLLGKESLSIKLVIKNFMPITFERYWFMSCYIVLYIFIPYINKALNHLKRDEHLRLIMIGIFLFSIVRLLVNKSYYGNELIQFFLFYSIGAFFGKYKKDKLCDKKTNMIVFFCSCIALVGFIIIFDLLSTKYVLFERFSYYIFYRTSIIAIIFSVSLFNIFSKIKSFYNGFINTISSLVLGVYLISDNYYVRHIIWNGVSKYISSPLLILHMIASVLIVFIVCCIIDYVRKNTIEKLGLIIYDKVGGKK